MSMNNAVNAFGSIDQKSYILGMITAFAECVSNECKKVALSPPSYPEDYHRYICEGPIKTGGLADSKSVKKDQIEINLENPQLTLRFSMIK